MVLAVFDGPGARQHRNAPADELDRAAQERVVFDVVQRGGFAGGTGDDDALGAAIELQLQQATPGVEVEFAGCRERRRQAQ